MSDKKKESVEILQNKQIASGIYDMRLRTSIVNTAKPGQFVNLFLQNEAKILPRPISICEIDKKEQILRLVYRISGEGTREISSYQPGSFIEMMGPLGNGYDVTSPYMRKENAEPKMMLLGGGIGIPPMLELAKYYGSLATVVLGYRDELFLFDDFQKTGATVLYATDSGISGVKGTVMDVIEQYHLKADIICSCGPKPMLAAVKNYALQEDILCFLSMEERMACGIGACLACVCQSTSIDDHSKVKYKRVCADGPVFEAREVEL